MCILTCKNFPEVSVLMSPKNCQLLLSITNGKQR